MIREVIEGAGCQNQNNVAEIYDMLSGVMDIREESAIILSGATVQDNIMDEDDIDGHHDQPAQLELRKPVMVLPYLSGISNQLQQIARKYGLDTWFTYPGRSSDRFSRFKGQVHRSKASDIVYCTQCSCGLQYVGESFRNLKVRLNEHTHSSSRSALTDHMLNNKHKMAAHNTTILAREGNKRKRRILES